MHDHKVYAVKYAEQRTSSRAQFFFNAPTGYNTVPGGLDFFVWVVETPGGHVVVDAGYTRAVAEKRQRLPHLREPSDAVRLLGVDPGEVGHVVITHFHYDHVGDLDPFTRARFVVQDAEMESWTGRNAARREMRRYVEEHDIQRLVSLSLAGRVDFVDGTATVVPGVDVHRVGGHTPGMQVVSVETARGTVVLASDAAHLEEHVLQRHPSNLFTDLREMYAGYDLIHRLAGSEDLIVSGHDPLTLERFPSVPGLDGVAVQIA